MMLFDWSCTGEDYKSASNVTRVEKSSNGKVFVCGGDTTHMCLFENDTIIASNGTIDSTDTSETTLSKNISDNKNGRLHDTSSAGLGPLMRFTDGLLICRNCRLLWDTISAQSGGAPGISIQALGPGSRFFHRRSFQDRICYNPRPFAEMTKNVLTSYKRLASVFELNWTVIEPLTCCVGETHPVIAAAAVNEDERRRGVAKPWVPMICGGLDKRLRRSSSTSVIIHPPQLSSRGSDELSRMQEQQNASKTDTDLKGEKKKRLYSLDNRMVDFHSSDRLSPNDITTPVSMKLDRAMVDDLTERDTTNDSLDGRDTFRSPNASSQTSSPVNSSPSSKTDRSFGTGSSEFLYSGIRESMYTDSVTKDATVVESGVGRSTPEIKDRCEVPAYFCYFISPFILESQRCIIQQSPVHSSTRQQNRIKNKRFTQSPPTSFDDRSELNTERTVQPKHLEPSTARISQTSRSTPGPIALTPDPSHHHFQLSSQLSSQIPFSIAHQRSRDLVSSLELSMTPNLTFFESRVLMDVDDDLVKQNSEADEVMVLSHRPTHFMNPDLSRNDTSRYAVPSSPPFTYRPPSCVNHRSLPPYTEGNNSHGYFSGCSTHRDSRTSNNTKRDDTSNPIDRRIFHHQLKVAETIAIPAKPVNPIRLYVEEQLQRLKLFGCIYPEDLFVMFLRIPHHIQQHLRFPISQRRQLDLLPFDRQKTPSQHHNRTFNVTTSSSKLSINSSSLAPVLQRKTLNFSVGIERKDVSVPLSDDPMQRTDKPKLWDTKHRPKKIENDHENKFENKSSGLNDCQPSRDIDKVFERLVKSKCDKQVLYIKTRSLRPQDLLIDDNSDHQNNIKSNRKFDNQNCSKSSYSGLRWYKNDICSSSQDLRKYGKVALVVLLGGKDMLALDWLPFLSHFFNFAVGDQTLRDQTSSTERSNDFSNQNLDQNSNQTSSKDSKSKAIIGKQSTDTAVHSRRVIQPLVSLPMFAWEEQKMGDEDFSSFIEATYQQSHQQNEKGKTSRVNSYSNGEVKTELHVGGGGVNCGIRSAFMMLEYPGSGSSCGPPSVRSIVESAVKSVDAAIRRLTIRLNPSTIDVRIIGYSLGAAVALPLADHIASLIKRQKQTMRGRVFASPCKETDKKTASLHPSYPTSIELHRVILIAPFTSVTDWAAAFLRVPVALRKFTGGLAENLIESGIWWDNMATLSSLCSIINSERSAFEGFRLSVLHGVDDSTVPFSMGHQLATEAHRLLHPNSASGSFVLPTCGSSIETPSTNNSKIPSKLPPSPSTSKSKNSVSQTEVSRARSPSSQSPLERPRLSARFPKDKISPICSSRFGSERPSTKSTFETSHPMKVGTQSMKPIPFASPLNRVPLNRAPLNRVPLNRAPLNRVPLNRAPLNVGPAFPSSLGKDRDHRKPLQHHVFSAGGGRRTYVKPEKTDQEKTDQEETDQERTDQEIDQTRINGEGKNTAVCGQHVWSWESAGESGKMHDNIEPTVDFFELAGDHQSILSTNPQQEIIFRCFFSQWMTVSISG